MAKRASSSRAHPAHLLLDGARREQPPDVDAPLLAVAENPRHRLLVGGGIPVGVVDDQPVGGDQVEAGATRARREQEGKLVRARR
eukprot:4356691-Prymnesium_polylepis.1